MIQPRAVIRSVRLDEVDVVVGLWTAVGLAVEPGPASAELRDLLSAGSDLVLVAEVRVEGQSGVVAGAVMGTWDGRRGWLHRLATRPEWRGRHVARALVSELESRLRARGCTKLNLLVEAANATVVGFYERRGFSRDELIFMQKRL